MTTTTRAAWLHALGWLLAASLAGGCASGGGALGEVQEAVADLLLPPAQEAQLGDRMAAEVQAQERVRSDARVSEIGRRLLASAGPLPVPYNFGFRVVEDAKTVNAFALPGGHVYVTSGLMRLADSEAQLASVIAHEIAHVTERHIAERLATQYGVQMLAGAALGQQPGLIGQLVGSLLQQGFLLKYSREQELQADRVGLRYLRQAGYPPQAAVQMFRKLAAGEGGGGPPEFLSSHPTTERRIEELQELIDRGG